MEQVILELPDAPQAALLDGAIALALATSAPLFLAGPLDGADLEVLLAAASLSGEPAALDAARASCVQKHPPPIALPPARPGTHRLALREPGSVSRIVTALSWPLALLGRPSEWRLSGPNHCAGFPGFHDLNLAWAVQAAAFGLRVRLELGGAAFEGDAPEKGELLVGLDPAPALTPLRLSHRGLLRQVTLLGASGADAHEETASALACALRKLRRRGVNAESRRVPLPVDDSRAQPSSRRWALTAVAEFEHSVVSVSAIPFARAAEDKTGGGEGSVAEQLGAQVAERLDAFLSSHGAVDFASAERMLIPAMLCASGLGARAGAAPPCHFTTTQVTEALVALAGLAHRVLPVRAVIDGAPGDPGVIVVAPSAALP